MAVFLFCFVLFKYRKQLDTMGAEQSGDAEHKHSDYSASGRIPHQCFSGNASWLSCTAESRSLNNFLQCVFTNK